ncbi:hypothetical protein QOZ80_3BG0277860 [Eleusine coracana subsp. coracana]|nr:hypothetical protein QOZ80_3BG0277860 [Eleusine coracana subsp. coracana]
MVKMNYRDLFEVTPSSDAAHQSSSPTSDHVDPSENGMETGRFSVTPSSGGSGGRSVGNTSSRRRGRMSEPASGTRLMPHFNAAAAAVAADGGDFWLSSSVGLELGLDEWRRRNIRIPALPEAPLSPNQLAHYLLFGSPMRSPAAEDDVLIMDGVLVGNSESSIASSTRRSVSLSGPRVVASSFPGYGGGSSYGSNGQFAQGWEGPRRMQTMRPRFSEVASPGSGRFSAGSSNMQGGAITRYLFPPSQPGPAFPTYAPRAISSYTNTAVAIRPPAPYFTPPRVTVTAARPTPLTPVQPETEPVQPPPATTTFTWPPTAEEDAIITQKLYGPTTGARRRLPVFEAICPGEAEAE